MAVILVVNNRRSLLSRASS